ncbi:MAG TPA: VOC family protein [Gemmatimonadaceae bacterium]|nr:VOC family protein [Gemmatimonadaceae bacterium]
MGTGTHDLFGPAPSPEPALPGSYGQPPHDFRLPAATRLGAVRLQVADLERSLHFYQQVLGLRLAARDDGVARLSPQDDDLELVVLHARPGAAPMPQRGRLGLFHFAILLPDRAALGGFLAHLGRLGIRAGAGDHLVSEALYLHDPDGLGIEVYADRPRETWQRIGQELMLATDPVDTVSLLAASGNEAWTGMPAGTVMGHVHLHVGDLARASDFFSEALGFDRMTWRYPGALFMGAGGYHHHLGTNTWAGSGASAPAEGDAQLLEWTIHLPSAAELVAVAASLERAGAGVERIRDGALLTSDPWGTAIRISCSGDGGRPAGS